MVKSLKIFFGTLILFVIALTVIDVPARNALVEFEDLPLVILGCVIILILFTPIARLVTWPFKKYISKRNARRILESSEEDEWENAVERERKRLRQKELAQKARRYVLSEDYGVDYDPDTSRRQIPPEIMETVFQRDRGRCVLCGAKEALQFDHVIPYSKGGSDNVENLRVLCGTCNVRKGNEFR